MEVNIGEVSLAELEHAYMDVCKELGPSPCLDFSSSHLPLCA